MIHDRSQIQRRSAYGAQDLYADNRLPGLQKTDTKTLYQSATARGALVNMSEKIHDLTQMKKAAVLQVESATPSVSSAEIFGNIKSSVSNWFSSRIQKKSLKTNPVVIFQSAFKGQKFPTFDEVRRSKNHDPKIFDACIKMLDGTMVGNAISFIDEFENLKSNPSLEKLIQLKEKYIVDPSKDDPFVFSDLQQKGLNLYQTTYNNFDTKFTKAIDDLKNNKATGDLSGVLAAFRPIVDAAQADASRNFYHSAQIAISRYHQIQSSLGPP